MVTKERIEEMEENFWSESNDEDTQDWRETLTDEEMKLVDKWDNEYAKITVKLCKQILDIENNKNKNQ